MPVYEYKCNQCGKVFDRYFSKIEDSFITQKCPKHECNGTGEKIYSTFSLGTSQESPQTQEIDLQDFDYVGTVNIFRKKF